MKRTSVAAMVCGLAVTAFCKTNAESFVLSKKTPATDRRSAVADGSELWQPSGSSYSIAVQPLCSASDDQPGFVPLFPNDGVPDGWTVRHWADVSESGPADAKWTVRGGILHGSTPRGTWLMSKKVYEDFELKFEFKLGPRGNSGCALRAPLDGDPAFDGIELQMADLRYNPEARRVRSMPGIPVLSCYVEANGGRTARF